MSSGFAKYVAKRLLRTRHDGVKVYLAVQRGFGREIELRIIDSGVPERSEEYLRFCREVKILAQLDHPSLLKVLDFGRAGTRVWYTTECRNAVTLEDLLLRVGGPLTADEVLEVARAIGSALGHIHAKGQIHRDVNSQSIFYDVDNKLPYVAEFALLKDLSKYQITRRGDATVLTRVLTPELVMALPYTAATDLFMFGALLYEIATATNPLTQAGAGVGSDVTELFAFPAPSTVNPGIPRWLDDAIIRLLAPEPSARPGSAEQFLQSLTVGPPPLLDASSIDVARGEILKLMRDDVASSGAAGADENFDWDDIDKADENSADGGFVTDETSPVERPEAAAASGPPPDDKAAVTRPVRAARPASLAQSVSTGPNSAVRQPASGRAPFALPVVAALVGTLLLVTAVVIVVVPESPPASTSSTTPSPATTASAFDPDETSDAVVRPAGPLSKDEEAVLEVTQALRSSPVTKDNFIGRLKILKDYALSLSDKDRNRVMPYKRIMAIKVEYYRHPEKACERLTVAFEEVRDYIKGR